MNTVNRGEEELGGLVWESAEGSTLPKHEESVYSDQKVIQLRISEHILVDRDEDWSDIHIQSSQKVEESKILKSKDGAANKGSQDSKVNPAGHKLGGDKALIKVNINSYLQYLDLTIRSVGAFFEFLFIIFLHILGIQKTRQTRRKKRVVANKSPKRRAKVAAKKYSANKKKTESSKQRVKALNWKKVDAEFVPSSNLYCYWCTKKLGLKSWEFEGHYYCDSCHSSKNVNLR
ncbi:hypothetical protein VC178_08225 [Polynucleobacter sp. AP-Sanab-80-C2]|uniref:hypothetical protein n=1 Tax=Polynucleobacter sp. AP-Sanab-80-C2 TaxID=3108274 RepID=UPI002B227FAC|nr:hypothetical protein [Polynucleobacter sp. AP-Sanab-80-C2]MEA9599872.1 hypothetical protein [Polynucleobacter sp. AP-Sanab-80-C2]